MTENQIGAVRRGSSASQQAKTKKVRTPKSCDRCKSRKTKCIDPVPGPCRYCAHIGAECGVANRPKQRPYYHVSEEEYRCSMNILRHFLPQEELNLETLRAIANDLKIGNSPPQQANKVCDPTGNELDNTGSHNDSEAESEEIGDLHEQLGCLMKDSLGEYRYVGAYSEIAFNAAVCSIKDPPSPEIEESKIILPPKDDFPPQKPERVRLLEDVLSPTHPYLPPREHCDHYVSRFFEEVHCIYWLYPVEQFHARLDDTYMSGGGDASSSWLCSLYAIFALGAASGSNSKPIYDNFASFGSHKQPDLKTSDDYLVLAKTLVPAVHDEADIDSIRALAILSLALLTFKFRITSYLYMGTSMQIAFSLGLQHDQSPTTQSPVTRQQNRRIWWTLYIMDQEIASRCGSPCVSDERSLQIQTPLPSEQILNPGPNTPLSTLPISVSLNRLKRSIITTIYPSHSTDNRKISFAAVSQIITALQSWLSSMPSHLKWGVPVAPTHKRSIGILHLNYWNAMMLLTQPFLLYLAVRASSPSNTTSPAGSSPTPLTKAKKTWFNTLGDICIDAARNAISVLRTMSADGSLSSLVTFDCVCTLKIIMILSLELARNEKDELRRDIEFCVSVLGDMEQVGFCKSVVQELPMRLKKMGVKKEETNESNTGIGENGDLDTWTGFYGDTFTGFQNGDMQGIQNLGDFNMDMDLFMDLEVDVSSMHGAGHHFQPSLDFFSGSFDGFDGL